MDFDKLAQRIIRPTIEKLGLEWYALLRQNYRKKATVKVLSLAKTPSTVENALSLRCVRRTHYANRVRRGRPGQDS